MAHSLSARKRIRQNLKKRLHNKSIRTTVRTQIKRLRSLINAYKTSKTQGGSNESSKVTPVQLQQELQKTHRFLDKVRLSGIFHPNKSNRLKSRLTLAVNKAL